MPKDIDASRIDLSWPTEIQYARLLGMSVARWAHTEEALTMILAALLGIDERLAEVVLYASKSEQLRVDMIRRLAALVMPDDEVRQSLLDAMTDFLPLVGKRNIFVHGLWKGDSRGKITIIPTKSGPIDWFEQRAPVTTADLRKFYDDVLHFDTRLLEILREMRIAFAQISRGQSRRRILNNEPLPKPKRVKRKRLPQS